MRNEDALTAPSAGLGSLEHNTRPDLGNVIVGLVMILIGIPFAMSLLFIFIGAPMIMAGVELLTKPSSRVG